MVSACGAPGHHRSDAHDAFYAAKSAQAGFTEILSKRLRSQGVRVISLYPPDFVECVLFAVAQPRDCFIKAFHFEQA